MLGWGLNVVDRPRLLDLGYVAFYTVGAHLRCWQPVRLGFWEAFFVSGATAATFGMLGWPILRLRGDYLAIVTLGFGEIVHLILVNWTALSQAARASRRFLGR